MTDLLFAIGALLSFCLLTFGAAWLMAAWMGAPRGLRRRKRSDRY